ncbi:MAG: hypothetical protein WCW13_06820 [archaeon]|jgi:signal peptidase I
MAKFKNKSHFNKKSPSKSSSSSKVNNLISKLSQYFSFLKWFDPFTYVDMFVMPQVKKINNSEVLEFIVNVLFALIFAWAIYTILGILFNNSTPLVIVYSASMENTFFRGDVMGLTKAVDADNFGEVVFLNRNIKSVPTIEFVSPIYSETKLSGFLFKNSISSTNEVSLTKSGSVIVYPAFNPSSSDNGKPIIHRAVVKLVALDGNFVLTKGDNSITNSTFDQDCGVINQNFSFSEKPCITLYATPVSEVAGKAFFRIPLVGCVKLWLIDDFLSVITTGKLPRDFKGIC